MKGKVNIIVYFVYIDAGWNLLGLFRKKGAKYSIKRDGSGKKKINDDQ